MTTIMSDAGQRLALDQRLLDITKTVRMAAEVAAGEDPGTIKGTACRYGVLVDRGWGLYLELVAGCFAGALKDPARTLVLWQHDSDEPIGKLSSLTDSPERLAYTGWVTESEDVPTGRRALSLLRDGVIDQVSIGFQIQKYSREVDEEADTVTYRILKAWLQELSIVTFGAFGDRATVEQVFAAHGQQPAAPALIRASELAKMHARVARWL